MIGAIIGDIVGSRFEIYWKKTTDGMKFKEFDLFHRKCRFTDDSVMTLAIAEALLLSEEGLGDLSQQAVCCMQKWGRLYPRAGYGGKFRHWIQDDNPQPYNSFGNGSAMRVSACAYAADSLEEVIRLAHAVTAVTHNHPEGLKGAEATAVATFLARTGRSMQEIKAYTEEHYYPIDFTLDEIRPGYFFDVTCQGSVPQALACFFESTDYENCIRNAVSLAGDTDTQAAIAGAIAGAFYGVPTEIREQGLTFLDAPLRDILTRFESRFPAALGRSCYL